MSVVLVVGRVLGGVLLVWENVVCPGWLGRKTWVRQWYGVV